MEKPLAAVREEYSFFCARVIFAGRGWGGSGILDGSGALGALGAWLSTLMDVVLGECGKRIIAHVRAAGELSMLGVVFVALQCMRE